MDQILQEHDAPSSLEGRLLAQRQVLGLLVAMSLRPHKDHVERLCDLVNEDKAFSAHQEDPGSDPDLAFALQSRLCDELRAIAREASRWLQPEPA